MPHRLSISWLLSGLLLLGPLGGRAQSARAQQVLDSVRRCYRLPALAAAVVEPGRICYAYGGVRQLHHADPITLGDYFHLASNTKSITSLLTARLVEQGKLRWNSCLLEVVPELRGAALPAYANVTLDELLTHRAGIQPYTRGAEYQSLPAFGGTISEKRLQFARVVLGQAPMLPKPGEQYEYSNAGYVLAALMLERASHRSWEALTAQAMRRLRLRYELGFPNRHDARQPWGHWLQEPADTALTALGPTNPYQLRDYMAPAGDVAMSLPDFARLVQLHLRGLLGHSRYVSAASYQRLHFGRPGYAYGWGVGRAAATGEPISFHDGSAGSFYAHAILYPRQRVAFLVLANAGGEVAEQACNALRRLRQLYQRHEL